ncbi:MAG: gliding motility-associated C-terminal domain-containing protein [Flavobacterium sp.]|nr:gliding motility-associated C-terminal domain-containing protein [Flavobacterium sp.]MBP8157408.1 gliding motility-associated C-terminal domain-containing protein [Flavobacterium sp.]
MKGLQLRISLVLFFLTQLTFSQLSNFTLTVTKTDVTCTANGSLSITVSNTTAGSTILYSIYRLPDVTTPISVQSTGTLSGLSAGTYRVVATQSLGGQSGSQQQDVIIASNVTTLTYQISSTDEICSYDGTLTVNVLTGIAVSYEIFAGPIIRPIQPSNTFPGLTMGTYQVRVFDNCGEGVVQTFTVQKANTDLEFDLFMPTLSNCTMVRIGAFVNPSFISGVIAFPLTVSTTLTPPSGSAIVYNQTVNGGVSFSQLVPFYEDQTYNYTFTITDRCGTAYTINGVITDLSPDAYYSVLPQDCSHKLAVFFNVIELNLLSAPTGYPHPSPQSFTAQIVDNSVTVLDLTAGSYTFKAVNPCGESQTFVIEITFQDSPPFHLVYNVSCTSGSVLIYNIQELILNTAPAAYTGTLPFDYTSQINSSDYIGISQLPIGTYVFTALGLCGSTDPVEIIINIFPSPTAPSAIRGEGCQAGYGAVYFTAQMSSVTMLSAPASYPETLPLDVSDAITQNGTVFFLDMLPAGNYSFQVIVCGVSFTIPVTIQGYQPVTNITVNPNCGSFDLFLAHSSNNTGLTSYWMQKWNPNTNSWGHPYTDVAYTEGMPPSNSNSLSLLNNAINYNLATLGSFRVLKVFGLFDGIPSIRCYETLEEFEFNGLPKITDVYSVSCGSTFEVIVIAEGLNPLIYRITTKNGAPFVVQNGNSNVFSGLEAATYNFQVEDACGNVLNSPFEIVNPNPLEITANNILCNGENLTLSVPVFSFFQYQWWKGNDTTTILSTTNSLEFLPFNSPINNGTYYVSISYSNNQTSCLNQVLSYTINVSNIEPNAGIGNVVTYCGRQGNVDLFTLLQGNYDANGTWSELTSSGTLNNNHWNSGSVPFGTYQFKYLVVGNCNLSDEALINITIKEIPDNPIATSDSVICDTQSLNLYASSVPNANYVWTGPNDFSSTQQNPTLNPLSLNDSGTYSVYTVLDGCESSPDSITINVNALPDLSLNQECIDDEYVVTATSTTAISYYWTGPNNFSSSQNPIIITRAQTGVYSATVTDQNGCSVANTINVVRTICSIPKGVSANDDGDNDTLDLTGFGVEKLKIFNRYGMLVYEMANYVNQWKGQDKYGHILPSATYYYLASMETGEIKSGWVYLMHE